MRRPLAALMMMSLALPVLALPPEGALRFSVSRAKDGLPLGESRFEWQQPAEGQYQLRITTITTGLAALLKKVRIVQESKGRWLEGGWQPQTFDHRWEHKKKQEQARFDWATERVHFSGGQAGLSPAAQDIATYPLQLALLASRNAHPENLSVVSGHKLKTYRLDWLDGGVVETPLGAVATLRVVLNGTRSTSEVWLAREHEYLPVRIRFVDADGESFDQRLMSLETAPAGAPRHAS